MTPWDRRENNFDFMRLALALLVLYSHAFPLGTGSETREPLALLSHGQVTGGGFAVDSFFIMSGFLIAASAERSRSVWSFLGKRVRRIYRGLSYARC
jgi:peptidoglycan/LPS O-acetylase OafA/YrhL